MATDAPIVVLVEWRAPTLTPEAARTLAAETAAALRRVPGLLDIRFFGDFAGGAHWYLQTWASAEAHDAYMASEAMFRIRAFAADFVEGRPVRHVYDDYSPAPAGRDGGPA